jgi:hypothetical protein
MAEKILLRVRPNDMIVVSNLDRAFRSLIDCDQTLNFSRDRKFEFTLLDINIDTSTPFGRFFIQIIAAVKELERKEISRRTREALQYNRRHMRPHSDCYPLGWKVGTLPSGKSDFVPAEQDRGWCHEIVRLRHRRMNWHTIQCYLQEMDAKLECHESHKWSLPRIRKGYVAAICGFPKVFAQDLPKLGSLFRYLAYHDGRPPRLVNGAVSQGLLDTLLPMPRPLPCNVPRRLYANLRPEVSAWVDPPASPDASPDLQPSGSDACTPA